LTVPVDGLWVHSRRHLRGIAFDGWGSSIAVVVAVVVAIMVAIIRAARVRR
jgi:hypothetical protein